MVGKTLLSLFPMALSAFYLYLSLTMPKGTLASPGPGLFPIVIGLLGIIVSTIIIVKKFTGKPVSDSNDKESTTSFDWKSQKMVFAYVLALLVFVLFFEKLGCLLAVFAIITALAKICGLPRWRKPVILGICFSLAVYLLFVVIFKLPLPQGLLHF